MSKNKSFWFLFLRLKPKKADRFLFRLLMHRYTPIDYIKSVYDSLKYSQPAINLIGFYVNMQILKDFF